VRFIESPKNPKIKEIKKLLSSKKARDEKGQFVLEGPKAIEAYVQSGGIYKEFISSNALHREVIAIYSELRIFPLLFRYTFCSTFSFFIKALMRPNHEY